MPSPAVPANVFKHGVLLAHAHESAADYQARKARLAASGELTLLAAADAASYRPAYAPPPAGTVWRNGTLLWNPGESASDYKSRRDRLAASGELDRLKREASR